MSQAAASFRSPAQPVTVGVQVVRVGTRDVVHDATFREVRTVLVVWFLLLGRYWPWCIALTLEALSCLVTFVMASATPLAIVLLAAAVASLVMLLLPETRRYVNQAEDERNARHLFARDLHGL